MNRGDTLDLPRFQTGTAKPVAGIDYGKPHPFAGWKLPVLEACIGAWLSENPPRLELATLALDEIERRGNDGLRARMRFAHYGYQPIPWLAAAGAAVRRTFPPELLAAEKTGRPGAHVYVILRGGYTASSGWYGAYVGVTTRTVVARLAEHREGGPRSARGLPRHGIEPLWSLFGLLNPVPRAKPARLEWETRLHEALAPVVPKVTGDVAY